MSLLTVVQSACRRLALPVPAAVATSTDRQVLQMMAISNEDGQELADRFTWQALQTETTHVTLASESQGAIATIAPGFKSVINDTMWNRSIDWPIVGSLTPQIWQRFKANNITGPYQQFRIRGGTLYFIPAPAAGETVAFEYVSKNWVTLNAGGTGSEWAADADTSLLDEQLLTLGLIWRFKQIKGFDYDEDFNKYERRVNDAIGRDAGKMILNMQGGRIRRLAPGLPEGSWPI